MAFLPFDYGDPEKKKREIPLFIFLLVIALSTDGILSMQDKMHVEIRDEFGESATSLRDGGSFTATCASSAELLQIFEVGEPPSWAWNMTNGGVVFTVTNRTGVGNGAVFPGNLSLPFLDCTGGSRFEYHLLGAFVACDPINGILCQKDKEICALDTRANPRTECRRISYRYCGFQLAGPTEFFLCHKDSNRFTLKTECEALNSGTWSGVEVYASVSNYKTVTNFPPCKEYNDFWVTTPILDTLVLRQGIPVGIEPLTLKLRKGKPSSGTSIQCSLVPLARENGSPIQVRGSPTEGWTVEAGDLQGKRMKLLCYATKPGNPQARWQFYLYPARVVVKGDDGNFTCNWPNWTGYESEEFANNSCPEKPFLLKFPPEKHAENNLTFETQGIPTTAAPSSAPTTMDGGPLPTGFPAWKQGPRIPPPPNRTASPLTISVTSTLVGVTLLLVVGGAGNSLM